MFYLAINVPSREAHVVDADPGVGWVGGYFKHGHHGWFRPYAWVDAYGRDDLCERWDSDYGSYRKPRGGLSRYDEDSAEFRAVHYARDPANDYVKLC